MSSGVECGMSSTGIVGGVRVQFDFQHAMAILKILAAGRSVNWLGYRTGVVADMATSRRKSRKICSQCQLRPSSFATSS